MSQAMTLADMRDFVRDHLDSDSTELPNDLLDRFFQDGTQRIEQRVRRPSYRAVEYTFSTVAGTRTYDLDATSGLTTPAPLDVIDAIQGPSFELRAADHRIMRTQFPTNSDASGTPTWWSRLGRTLYLWPKPSSIISYRIIGYRQGTDWIGTGVTTSVEPDLPDPLHELIAWWGLNRAYAFLDDPAMADFYRQEFDQELRIRSAPYTLAEDAQPFIINGGTPNSAYTAGRLRYDWE